MRILKSNLSNTSLTTKQGLGFIFENKKSGLSGIDDLVAPLIDNYQADIQSKFGHFYTIRQKIYSLRDKAISLGRIQGMGVMASQLSVRVGDLLNKNASLQTEVDNMIEKLKNLGGNVGSTISSFKFNVSKILSAGANAITLASTVKVELPALFSRISQHSAEVNNVEITLNDNISQYGTGLSNILGEFSGILKTYGTYIGIGVGSIALLMLLKKSRRAE